jgi:hypothetical protein
LNDSSSGYTDGSWENNHTAGGKNLPLGMPYPLYLISSVAVCGKHMGEMGHQRIFGFLDHGGDARQILAVGE